MLKKIKILVVEDEALTARYLKIELEELGYDVLTPIAKGEDAIPVAIQENPDLILMDIRLAGGLDGIEAAERIITKKKIPIAFMTGYATEEIKERALKIYPLAYLEKPVDIDSINQILTLIKG
ncbi:response regulator [bacterium]|nr:response regulator [candidate division CSSED10-310 bacterium]